MKFILLSLVFILTLTHCNWLSFFGSDSPKKHPAIDFIDKVTQDYNDKKLEDYFVHFDPNINVFSTNGLGTARIVNGLKDFKAYTKSSHRAKELKLEVLDYLVHKPWVFTKQRSTINRNVVESVVAYRIENNKIKDIMIINEVQEDKK